MKEVLVVILDMFSDWESAYATTAINFFGQGKLVIKTVSLSKEKVRSLGGFSVVPDYDIESIPKDYEAILLIGGFSWRKESSKMVSKLVYDAYSKKKLIAAICDASAFLSTLGLLNEIKHTGNNVDDFKQWAKETYKGDSFFLKEPVVYDNNIITANGTATLEFTKQILLSLKIANSKDIEEWYDFYKKGCYEAKIPEIYLRY